MEHIFPVIETANRKPHSLLPRPSTSDPVVEIFAISNLGLFDLELRVFLARTGADSERPEVGEGEIYRNPGLKFLNILKELSLANFL
jgi:hypothetical protein